MSNLMKSYVWHKGKCFFVSTINRDSSAMYAGLGRYAETMVWEYDYENNERGDLVGQGEGMQDSIRTHMKLCQQLHETGALSD